MTPEDVLTAASRLIAETRQMRERARAMRVNAVTQRQNAERQRVRLAKSFSRFANRATSAVILRTSILRS
jgi:hypothetical protein